MLQSQLFTKTRKEAPKDETSKNAQLLIKAGYIYKEMAGVYSYLPLGLRVRDNINNIIRDEMNKAGGLEVFMTSLQDKTIWEKTNRWDDAVVDNWFKTELKNGTELGLAFTHEEALTNILTDYVSSYKDLPFSAYQIQTKFRNEARAKAGLMRGREFLMKDLYSFAQNEEEHYEFYNKMKDVYLQTFKRLGLGDETYLTYSSGGSFSKYSDEFQTVCDAGEDIIYVNKEKGVSINKDDFTPELLKDFGLDGMTEDDFEKKKSVEVGDIYTLGYKFSKALDLKFKNKEGKEEFVFMGSYGMSPTRLMGCVVELNNDENGIVWPESVSPFRVHLVSIGEDQKVLDEAQRIYDELHSKNITVLWDDRDTRPGQKFADSDLIGIPTRFVVSEKTIEEGVVEVKDRKTGDTQKAPLEQAIKEL